MPAKSSVENSRALYNPLELTYAYCGHGSSHGERARAPAARGLGHHNQLHVELIEKPKPEARAARPGSLKS